MTQSSTPTSANETVLWEGRPAARRYFLDKRIAWSLILMIAGAGLMIYAHRTQAGAPPGSPIMIAASCVLAFGIAVLLLTYWSYCSIAFTIRPHGVELREGIFSQKTETVLWNQLRGVELQRTIFDRLLGTGTIRFATGDLTRTDGQVSPHDVRLSSITEAPRVYRLVQDAISRATPTRGF